MKIVSNPDRVCPDHAAEFWAGLLTYAHDRSEPCVKHERLCSCKLCEEMSAAFQRASAIATTQPSPGDHDRFPIRLAS
jgi:hypothetical protein